MTVDRNHDARTREAADWFARLNQRRVESADVEAFSTWRRDPANAKAFSRLEALWDAAGVLATDPEIATLTQAAAERLPHQRKPTQRAAWKPRAALAFALILLGGAVGLWFIARPATYVTGFGEREFVELSDGSTVQLDANSRIAVSMRGSARRVELLSGGALFQVQHDPDRSFVVTAGDAQIVALGTRFDVHHRGPEVRVVLVEGRVKVQAQKDERQLSWTLEPNQQITPTAEVPVVASVNAKDATSWTTGRLVFDRTPLSAAIADVNRYSPTVIELRSVRSTDIEISGVFDTGDVDGFVSAVTALYPLRSASVDGVVVLHDAPKK